MKDWQNFYLESFFIGLGFFFGVMLLLFIFSIYGTVIELLLEIVKGEWKLKNEQFDRAYGNPKAIVISDLHVDTWTGTVAKDRKDQIKNFADAIKQENSIRHLIVNGDIIDIPKHPKDDFDPSTLAYNLNDGIVLPNGTGNKLPELKELIDPLFDIPDVEVTYIIGNHDVGLQSTRSYWKQSFCKNISLIWSPSINLRFPNEEIENEERKDRPRAIHIEHGHLVDPFIWLYIKQAIGDLTKGRDIGSAPVSRTATKAPDLKPESVNYGKSASIKLYGNLANRIAMLQFRYGARKVLNKYARTTKKGEIHTRVVLFGHTHAPDRFFFKTKTGLKPYFNSGSWTSDRDVQTYLVIFDNGWVTGPHAWEIGSTSLEINNVSKVKLDSN